MKTFTHQMIKQYLGLFRWIPEHEKRTSIFFHILWICSQLNMANFEQEWNYHLIGFQLLTINERNAKRVGENIKNY